MTNILFCYWLQGYFEITSTPVLNKMRVKLILATLGTVTEPLPKETAWIKEVCEYIAALDFKIDTMKYFSPLVQRMLNSMFYHYLDNHKDYTLEELEYMHNQLVQNDAG